MTKKERTAIVQQVVYMLDTQWTAMQLWQGDPDNTLKWLAQSDRYWAFIDMVDAMGGDWTRDDWGKHSVGMLGVYVHA